MKALFLSLLLLVILAPCSWAAEMTYIYHQPESATDHRYDYHWEILKAALEKSKAEFGPYVMKPAAFVMNETRQMKEVESGKNLTVIVSPNNSELEAKLVPVRIPIDKGLIGYRVFLINKNDQSKYSAVKSEADLKQYSCGQGKGWTDVKIWRANGFKVIEGASYDGLFQMTVKRRFDFFSRGIVEIIGEYEKRKGELPDLGIEQSIVVHYPYTYFFYFPPNDNGKALAKRVEKGLLALFEDKDAFNAIFMKYNGEALKYHNLKSRTLIKLKNPLISPETPINDKRLWYDPFSE